ncbi:MAG: ABC transporter ATP-binding protein [Leptolyngbyaceae bacterium]|nr:ABC transporter ATP-binding protein [Leptolyngbyaceae bacterium]
MANNQGCGVGKLMFEDMEASMADDDILVKVEGVAKKYCKDLKRSLRYGLQELAGELFLRQNPPPDLRRYEFWALQDVNFELRRGEAFGIIGVNGSGKTTLLKIMQGLLKPTQGRVTMRGQVGALISLGAGFQPLLTGRENIYVNASILRVPRRQVDQRLDDILAFADIGDFIDAPIKTYSSGMRGRLGFAIATHLIDPDILLLDEVLATGDWKFKDRCFRRMEEIVSSGATVVFVSHLVPKVEKFCNRAMLLHKGVVKGVGPATEICQMYHDLPEIESVSHPQRRRQRLAKMLRQTPEDMGFASNGHDLGPDDNDLDDLEDANFLEVDLCDAQGHTPDVFHTLDMLVVRIQFGLDPWPEKVEVVVQFLTPGDEISVSHFPAVFPIMLDSSVQDKGAAPSQNDAAMTVDCTIPELLLRAGKYRVSVTITPMGEDKVRRSQLRLSSSTTIAVKDQLLEGSNGQDGPKKSPGLVYMPANWRLTTPTSPSTATSNLEAF